MFCQQNWKIELLLISHVTNQYIKPRRTPVFHLRVRTLIVIHANPWKVLIAWNFTTAGIIHPHMDDKAKLQIWSICYVYVFELVQQNTTQSCSKMTFPTLFWSWKPKVRCWFPPLWKPHSWLADHDLLCIFMWQRVNSCFSFILEGAWSNHRDSRLSQSHLSAIISWRTTPHSIPSKARA